MSVNINDLQLESEPSIRVDTMPPGEPESTSPTLRPDDLQRITRALAERAARVYAD